MESVKLLGIFAPSVDLSSIDVHPDCKFDFSGTEFSGCNEDGSPILKFQQTADGKLTLLEMNLKNFFCEGSFKKVPGSVGIQIVLHKPGS